MAKYADLFERMLDAVFLLDPSSHVILEANPACERILGGPAEKLVGRSLDTFLDPSHRDDFGKAMRVAMRRFHPRLFESQWKIPEWLAPGGKSLTMEVLACPLQLSDKEQVLQVIARDISFRREAELKMQALLSDLQAANHQLQILSTVDGMTGLYNFRHFKEMLITEHTRSDRYQSPYALVFVDIDFFKVYNDKNGHPAGDALLTKVGEILKHCVRNTDFPARYGGEEFVVLCPEVTWEGAKILAERIRKMIAETPFANADKQPSGQVTVSVGVASFPHDGATAESIVQAADQSMYYSKTHGKNQVTCFQEISESERAALQSKKAA